MPSTFDAFITHNVVLDTAGTIVYLGRLVAVDDAGFVLEEADLHDCNDGHASKELYINEARAHGISPNRTRVLVLRSTVISLSKLTDVAE